MMLRTPLVIGSLLVLAATGAHADPRSMAMQAAWAQSQAAATHRPRVHRSSRLQRGQPHRPGLVSANGVGRLKVSGSVKRTPTRRSRKAHPVSHEATRSLKGAAGRVKSKSTVRVNDLAATLKSGVSSAAASLERRLRAAPAPRSWLASGTAALHRLVGALKRRVRQIQARRATEQDTPAAEPPKPLSPLPGGLVLSRYQRGNLPQLNQRTLNIMHQAQLITDHELRVLTAALQGEGEEPQPAE